MEAFERLPKEKKERIYNAALKCFGANGYRKTSMQDIATEAGISKPMVFHYFSGKQALYEYLLESSERLVADAVRAALPGIIATAPTDFFDRVQASTRIKVALMKAHPDMLSFLTGVYYERDPQVWPKVECMLARGERMRNQVAMDQVDAHKFKPGIQPKQVLRILTWMAEGYASELPRATPYDLEAGVAEFNVCMELIRKNFYKEEYL